MTRDEQLIGTIALALIGLIELLAGIRDRLRHGGARTVAPSVASPDGGRCEIG